MANYYTYVSFAVDMSSAEQANEAVELLAHIEDLLEQEEATDDGIEWESEFAVFKEFDCGVDVELSAEDKTLWFRDDSGCVNVDFLAVFLKFLVKRYMPDSSLGFEWANDCSKHILDSFGGGLAFVTADDITFVNTGQMLSELRAAHAKKAGAAAVAG